ncbi:DUF3558 domain-containing protein [Tsukamurella paurometabola]|uniref:DUF3558 domain-containing protein n=1 Tax=Tsukamurella paurometabola TaxID=2061 RepID=A0ABS5NKR4_TSUPA|nr:DUF3558 domain-containing protein [Tsukamurella paurometabola]MBS4104427.1 DUF3558 domain-containing protein [Tsukamurella paurometabola]
MTLLSGCAVGVAGQPTPAEGIGAQSTEASLAALPFIPKFGGRTNERNNGTSFEPCVAYSEDEIRALGADPRTLADAAISDSPNYRGCHWQSSDGVGRYSQIVGNERSTEAYKAKQSYRPWQADRLINGRVLIVSTENAGCFASFMSQGAMVHSSFRIGSAGTPSADLVTECNKAIEWATLAISKAP